MNETLHAREKYRGPVAESYEDRRTDTRKWASEQKLLDEVISGFRPGSTALDIPCGTGRLHEFFAKHGIDAIGMDVNHDMRSQAMVKGMTTRYGDVTYIPMTNKAVSHSFCIRLLNWLSERDVKRALGELQRVTRESITFTLRVAQHPRARPLSLVEESLNGFRVAHNRHIDDGGPDTFRLITLEPIR